METVIVIENNEFATFKTIKCLTNFLLKLYNLEENLLKYKYYKDFKIELVKNIDDVAICDNYCHSSMYHSNISYDDIINLGKYFGASNIYFTKLIVDFISSYKKLDKTVIEHYYQQQKQFLLKNYSWIAVNASNIALIKDKGLLRLTLHQMFISNGYLIFT